MATTTLTVRVEPDLLDALNLIAEASNRDRSFIVNEALDSYVLTHQWQVEHIRKGKSEAEEGKFVPEAEVKRRIARLKKK